MAVVPPLAAEQLPDGVYLGLSETDYFAQDRLGSSDVKDLHFHREGWWWSSRHNPDRDNSQSDAQNYGTALHAIMLEGLSAYEDRFRVEPDWKAYGDDLLTSQRAIRAALEAAGWEAPKGISKWVEQDWFDACALYIPNAPVKAQLQAEFDRRIATKTAADGTVLETMPTVTAVEDRMLRIMYDAATDPAREDNAEIRELLGHGTGIPALAEVSVLFTCPWTGTKRRARFDKPVPWHTVDLKSLSNWRGTDLTWDLDGHIKRNGYDVQVADQHVARILAYRMLAEAGERVLHGGTKDERAFMLAMVERSLPWGWAWLFYQKPEPTGRAPILFPVREAWKGLYHQSGHRKAYKAIHRYVALVERFGLDKPWSRIERVHYTDENLAAEHDAPRIMLGHNGWDEDAVPGEDDLFDHRDLPRRPAASAPIV